MRNSRLTRPALRPGRRYLAARPGVALMLVLWILVVLGAIGSSVVLATRSTTGTAANYRARVVARYAAESGVTVAVAALEDSLAALTGTGTRREYLNGLDRALGPNERASLGDARFAIALIDPGARLDVNTADAASLARLFSFFTDALEAETAAGAIRAFIGGGLPNDPADPSGSAASPGIGLQAARPLGSLDDLTRIPGVSRRLAERAAPFLTVDGDGTVNRTTASDTVLAAAAGDLRDEPSRILIISRGWLHGQPLTHEIQAVYAVAGSGLILVRWRERDL